MFSSANLPSLNAILNGSCAILLVIGLVLIRRGQAKAHQRVMEAAFLISILFLISYLTYHTLHGSTPFQGQGWTRPIYFSLLISHSILAALVVPLAIRTLVLAAQNRLEEHKRLARWTFPIWLYVSVTGVVVYWVLYRMTWI